MAQVVRRLRWSLARVRFNTSSATAKVKEEAAVDAGAAPGSKSGGRAKAYLSGVTVATLAMVGVLHGRRMYEEREMELARQSGIELEFKPDKKASFLQLLPLRSISRAWGWMASTNLPVWARPVVYKSWARAFHTDLDDVPLPLEEYSSLREFFTRELKEGSRPIDSTEKCMVSPVDGVVIRYGRVGYPGATVEQVKGFTYSLSALFGSEPCTLKREEKEEPKSSSRSIFWFWRSQPATVKSKEPSPPRELFYCVLYLGPGDYHRVHSPANFCVDSRVHFSGDLYPVNERATRTIKDLYVMNERVTLEGEWQEGYMGMALVGATNMGSIELKFEPLLKTNDSEKEKGTQEISALKYCVRKGDELATFNMGSTVVLVFEAPGAVENLFNVLDNPYQGFNFNVVKGERIKLGQSLGHW